MGRAAWERLSLAFAAAMSAGCLYLVPSWESAAVFSDPCVLAAIASGLLILILAACRYADRNVDRERQALTVFLAGMPIVYLLRGLLAGTSASAGWFWVECAGAMIFEALAWIGYRRLPWLLAFGIVAHGMLWDSWHFHSTYIPSWYALGCLLVDVGVGFYAAVRISTWPRNS